MEIIIPTVPVRPFTEAFQKLCEISSIANTNTDGYIEIDFSKCGFMSISFIAGLSSLVTQWEEKGLFVNYKWGNTKSYLDTLNFPTGFNIQSTNSFNNFSNFFRNRTYLPLTTFSIYHRDSAFSDIMSLIKRQISPSEEYANAIEQLISELGNNVYDHSEAEDIIITAQHYTNKNHLDLVIMDRGIGLYNCFKKSGKYEVETEAGAFQLAMEGKSTKDMSGGRGFGLSGSRKVVTKGVNGKFLMWSGQTVYAENNYTKGIMTIGDGLHNYNGCMIFLRLPFVQKVNVNIIEAYSN